MKMYPLKFQPIYKAKVWGGRSLEKLGRTLPTGQKIGESWELADLGATSVSGGGGGAERSIIDNGPLAGQSIHDAIRHFGGELMGRLPPCDDGGFPLLVKFLDAAENLSVQVHPSEAYTQQHSEAHLKSEAWYILHAEPGAVIYKGVKEGVTPESFRDAIADNRVEELMIAVAARAGEIHYLPSGTCHALGAGILVAEVQTPSDTTFRVYDWGRQGRELHLSQAMECITFGPADTSRHEPGTKIEREMTTVEGLVRCEHFHMDRVKLKAGYRQALTDEQPVVWMVLSGKGEIMCEHADDRAARTAIAGGQTLLLPAVMDKPMLSVEADMTLLEVTFPCATNDLIA
ncbi:MAG: type I phosphomannose isomerase catalytic subunit [Phycisphaeraceae bacterium]